MNPLARFLIMVANLAVLQWLFVRICWMERKDGGGLAGVGVMFPVVPLTGYGDWEYVPRQPPRWICWKKGVKRCE